MEHILLAPSCQASFGPPSVIIEKGIYDAYFRSKWGNGGGFNEPFEFKGLWISTMTELCKKWGDMMN